MTGVQTCALPISSEKIALEALKLIEVDYEDLPALYDPQTAIQPDAPILHPKIKEYNAIHPYIKYGNVCMDATIHRGNIEEGFANADLVVKNTFCTKPMHQASLEPHGCLAEFDQYGKLTIWTATQQMSVCHSEVAKALNIPITQVKVIPATLGGGFGGKLKTLFEQICALLAEKSGLPVKLFSPARKNLP